MTIWLYFSIQEVLPEEPADAAVIEIEESNEWKASWFTTKYNYICQEIKYIFQRVKKKSQFPIRYGYIFTTAVSELQNFENQMKIYFKPTLITIHVHEWKTCLYAHIIHQFFIISCCPSRSHLITRDLETPLNPLLLRLETPGLPRLKTPASWGIPLCACHSFWSLMGCSSSLSLWERSPCPPWCPESRWRWSRWWRRNWTTCLDILGTEWSVVSDERSLSCSKQ